MIRRKGRPRGSRNGHRLTIGWNPKKWKPIHDSIIALAITGIKNTEIAQQLNLNPVTISLVLNSSLGREKLGILQKLKQETIETNTQERVTRLQEKALSRIERVMNSDEIFEAAPLKIFDRSLRVLQATGKAKPTEVQPPVTNSSVVNNNLIVGDPAILSQLNAGLQKALEAKALHDTAFKQLVAGGSSPSIDGRRLQPKIP